MIRFPALVAAALTIAPAAAAPPAAPDPTLFSSGAELQAQADAMTRAMAPGQGFAWKKVAEANGYTTGMEVWRKPGKPAVHPDQAEYALVVAGAGTMVTGGTLVNPAVKQAELTEGDRIEGGTTRTLKAGDVILIPAGVPHWFGITGDRLVLLGVKLPKQ